MKNSLYTILNNLPNHYQKKKQRQESEKQKFAKKISVTNKDKRKKYLSTIIKQRNLKNKTII